MGIVRKTKSVEMIKELLQKSKEALSVVELVELFKSQMNKTTVYRILSRLENEGFAHSFTDNLGLKWYAKCPDCSHEHHSDKHPLFQCKNCKKIECLDIDISIPESRNHHIENSDIFLIGICDNCYQ